jgi:hypothetical protein
VNDLLLLLFSVYCFSVPDKDKIVGSRVSKHRWQLSWIVVILSDIKIIHHCHEKEEVFIGSAFGGLILSFAGHG